MLGVLVFVLFCCLVVCIDVVLFCCGGFCIVVMLRCLCLLFDVLFDWFW